MGNNSSQNDKNSSKAINELTDVHRKCVKPYSGNASEEVDRFVHQLQAVKHVYNLTDQALLKLALEKIEGQALEWLHSKPGLMTLGVEHFAKELIKEFSPKKSSIENDKNNMQNAPSAPSKSEVCSEDLSVVNTGLYPDMTAHLEFSHLILEQPPPSYDTVLREKHLTKSAVIEPSLASLEPIYDDSVGTNSHKQESVKNSEKTLEEEKSSVKPEPKKVRHRRKSRARSANPINHQNDGSKITEDSAKPETSTSASGTRPKIICEYCQKIGHSENVCRSKLRATSNISFPVQTKSLLTCNYCKEEGHHIKDCTKIPRCRQCGEKSHKINNCPQLKPGILGNPNEPKLDFQKEPSTGQKTKGQFLIVNPPPKSVAAPNPASGYCKHCNKMGHHTVECAQRLRKPKPRCYRCNSEWHKVQDCTYPKSAQKNNESDCSLM